MEAGLGGESGDLFPQPGKLKAPIRGLIAEAVFADARLLREVDPAEQRQRLVLEVAGQRLPYMVWSAGQREFTPLLLGLYWLIPSGKLRKRANIDWIIIEEPEMGLHPQGIVAVMLAVLELLSRGYRVVLSTHSPQVLDVMWAIRTIQDYGGNAADLLDIFGEQAAGQGMGPLAEAVLHKAFRVFFFARRPDGVETRDISTLDPGDQSPDVAGWGGLTGFSGHVSDVVSRVVSRYEQKATGT